MRRVLAVIIVFSALRCSAQSESRRVATLHSDWTGSGRPTTFVLEQTPNSKRSGEFTRLRVLTPGKREYVLTDEDGMVNFREGNCSFHFAFCEKRNLIDSSYLLFLPVPGKRPLLFVFGYAYASSPGSLRVLTVEGKGVPYEVFVEKSLICTTSRT